MRTMLFLAALLLGAGAPAQAQQAGPPAWWLAHVEFMSRDGGRWIAPNPAGENDPDVPDAYAMEWRAASNGHGLIGRLYGVENGVEQDEYWTYREFWHPGERRAFLHQWGALGAYGVGETTAPQANRGEVDQTFWLPDGRHWREGHRTVEDGDTYVTMTFDIGADGSWTQSGSYTWRRAR